MTAIIIWLYVVDRTLWFVKYYMGYEEDQYIMNLTEAVQKIMASMMPAAHKQFNIMELELVCFIAN